METLRWYDRAKVCRTFLRIYSIFESERLSANIKVNLHKALISSVMAFDCPALEFTEDTFVLKLQRL
jgi:hypothetical protein